MLNTNGKTICEKCFCEAESYPCAHCGFDGESRQQGTALAVGTILGGKYVVGGVLGRGGFGITYKCLDLTSGTEYALKEYYPPSIAERDYGETGVHSLTGDSDDAYRKGAERFFTEAQTISKFNGNPGVVGVYTFFTENNTAYYVMEYLKGCDLKTYIKNNGGKVSVEFMTNVVMKITDTLTVLHSLKVFHRDISPDNIFICDDGNVKLIDFGAAKQLLTDTGASVSVISKFGYTPIEQFDSHGKQGAWTDIYALGATFYASVSGYLPENSLSRINNPTLPCPPEFAGNPALFSIIDIMLKVYPEQRFQSCPALKAALESVCFNSGYKTMRVFAREDDIPDTARQFKENFVKAVAIVMIAVIIVVAVALSGIIKKTFPDAVLLAVIIAGVVTAAFIGLFKKPSPEKSEDRAKKPKPANVQNTGICSMGLRFESNGDGTCCVSGIGLCGDISVSIPPVSDRNDAVTGISDGAFRECGRITSVVIPDGVKSIGSKAFYGCSELQSVTIPQSVTQIDNGAFCKCRSLMYVLIPESVISMGSNAFGKCVCLSEICCEADEKPKEWNRNWASGNREECVVKWGFRI